MTLLRQIIKIIALLFICTTVNAQELTLNQVLQRVVNHYPSIKRASIQVEKAIQEINKVESQLSWQLSAQAGVSQNVSPFGIASKTFDATSSLSKQLESGSSLSLDTDIRYDDADIVFSPSIPNPLTTTSVNLNYRKPLKQGSDNATYEQGKINAATGVFVQLAERTRLYDQLANTVIELYLSATITQARIKNIKNSIARTKRLQTFIQNRETLGISEEKDILQVNAQVKSQKAELSGLHVTWEKQRLSLNRLMASPIDESLEPVIEPMQLMPFSKTYERALKHSPEIKAADARIKLADSAIRLRRDTNDDQLDLVLYLGAKNRRGNVTVGSDNQSDVVGGARLEFSQKQDKSGRDAILYQAQLDRSTAIEDKRLVTEDLQYDIASLLAEINAAKKALSAYQKSVDSEKLKLKEAESRYKTGRADTDQIITFENQLSIAKLSFELQRIELSRRIFQLNLKQGLLWNKIHLQDLTDLIRKQAS